MSESEIITLLEPAPFGNGDIIELHCSVQLPKGVSPVGRVRQLGPGVYAVERLTGWRGKLYVLKMRIVNIGHRIKWAWLSWRYS